MNDAMAQPEDDNSVIISAITHDKAQMVFAIFALALVVLLDFSVYVFRPYDGMNLVGTGDHALVTDVYPQGPAELAGILPGDRINEINGRSIGRWTTRPLYEPNVKSGSLVSYTIQRGEETQVLQAVMGTYRDNVSLLSEIIGTQFLSLSFWAVGFILCVLVQPQNTRARLIGLGWLLAGIAMAAGGPGERCYIWAAYTLMEISWCFLSFTLVVSHLYFPVKSLARYRHSITLALAIAATLLSLLAIVDRWELESLGLPTLSLLGIDIHNLIGVFFLLSVLASVALLVRNCSQFVDPEIKRQTTIIIWGMVLGFAPFFILTLLPSLLSGGKVTIVDGNTSVLFLLTTALTYVYVIWQRKLLHVDFLINRAVILFVLFLLILMGSIIILETVSLVFNLPVEFVLMGSVLVALLSLPSAHLQAWVQRLVNKALYGCHYDFLSVTSNFSNHLVQTLDRNRLTNLLTHGLAQQMGIQQFALFLADGELIKLQQPGFAPYAITANDELCRSLQESEGPQRSARLWDSLPPAAQIRWKSFAWAQLFVPIIFEGQLVGILILGRRYSGDLYSDQDVQIIATIAHQAALAYANVQLVEALHALNQQLVRGDEAHRKQVARALHDTVLQQLFFIKQGLLRDQNNIALIDLLDGAIQTLRRTIREQRPPLLDQGLQLALQSLIEEMQRVSPAMPIISWHSNVKGPLSLSDEQITTLYRIAQEALTNALKHARAKNIDVILDNATNGNILLHIKDDGVGISPSAHDTWTREHHYGVAIMQERAAMIHGSLHVTSTPGAGTSITVEIST